MTQADAPRPRGRPRKDPAQSEARARLIRAGLEHLTEKGFTATGVDEILTAAGVPKGSFYHYFSGKEAFGLALIDAYQTYFADLLDRSLGNEALYPLDRLQDFTFQAEAGLARHSFRRGCLVGNLGQEMSTLPESFRTALTAVFEDWQTRTAACLRAAQQAGELDRDADPDGLATFFWIGWEGAILRAKLAQSPAPLRLFVNAFFATLPKPPQGAVSVTQRTRP